MNIVLCAFFMEQLRSAVTHVRETLAFLTLAIKIAFLYLTIKYCRFRICQLDRREATLRKKWGLYAENDPD